MLRAGLAVLIVTAALAGLAACAADDPPPPVLSIADHACQSAPVLSGATSLVLKPKKEGEENEIKFDMRDAPCVEIAGGEKAVYRLVALPEETSEYVISVESTPVGDGVFAPAVSLLDEQGKTLRSIPGDAFVFRGNSLSVLVRRHPGERYVLVVSDPDAVGKSMSRPVEGVQSSGYMVGYAYVQTYYGYDTTQNLTFALSGIVTVRVEPLSRPAAH